MKRVLTILLSLMMLPAAEWQAGGASANDSSRAYRPLTGREREPLCSHARLFRSRREQGHSVLPHPFDVRKYRLELEPGMGSGGLEGTVTLDCISEADGLERIMLNFEGNWDVSSVTVDGGPAEWDYNGSILFVDLPAQLGQGQKFTMAVSYQGTPASDPFHGIPAFYITSQFAYTFSEPFQARYWFPCFDEPSDKAEEGVEVMITVPRGFTAASNGLLVSRLDEGSQTIFHWRHAYPIATYLIAVAVARYSVLESSFGEVPLQYFVLPQDAAAAERDFGRTGQMMQLYSTRFGEYPFEKYGVAVVPSDRGWAMEHQTMTTYSDRLITGDRRYEYVAAHELAHHWWGDSVTIADFRDIWLNEGFASYAEILWGEHLQGEGERDRLVRNFRDRYLREDREVRYSLYRDDYDIGKMFGATIYKKGALVLHMLRWEMGDEAFFRGLRRYHRRNAYGSVTTQDFIAAMEWAAGRELDDFFDGWVYGTGYPEFEISSFYLRGKGSPRAVVTVHQHQDDPTVFAMSLPIDADGSGPLPPARREVSGRWFQFEVAVPGIAGAAEIKETDWLLMETRRADYPAPLARKVINRRIAPGATSSVTLTGQNFTPATRVKLSRKRITVESVLVNAGGTRIELRLSVPERIKPGPVGVTIINPDGDTAEKPKALRVTKLKR